PFHNGHKYHIEAAKEACNADHAVCVMSGSFVQRGEPAIFDKWSRAKMAVMNGADLVVELPVSYACQPAEIFAFGAVKILDGMGIIENICFGSELGDTEVLHTLARLLHEEPEDFSIQLRAQLGKGVSYPRAVTAALSSYLGRENEAVIGDILGNPNNVLGIEYIKALKTLGSSIQPVAVKRVASGHNDIGITGDIASATAIRREIKEWGISEKVRQSMPSNCVAAVEENINKGRQPIYMNNFSDLLLYRLRLLADKELGLYLNSREGIENRLRKFSLTASSSDELIEGIKTKRYTRTYIQRLLCHILLDIKRSDISAFKASGCPAYIRVLAFNDKGTRLIKEMKARSAYPVVTKVADFASQDDRVSRMFEYDITATNIYNLAYSSTTNKKGMEDYLVSPYFHRL
ncbi:MAG TPA: nucleotidyltransferase, partial [Negativicutes bacterium]|nr:nucleotidyltransferase [Negativicutes bacterium]